MEEPQEYTGDADEQKRSRRKRAEMPTDVTVTFRQNRKYDLHIGREMVTFRGRETKKIPASWVAHKDWDNVSQLFIVKGV